MLPKIFGGMTLAIAVFTIFLGYTQRSALHLRQESQPLYMPRHNTGISGYYYGGVWRTTPLRSDYGNFRGGGPSAGK